MLKLLLLFTLVPLVELWILIELGGYIGAGPTIILVASTGFIGVLLAKSQGLSVLYRIQKDLQEGVPPTDAILDGACVLVGGALLLTPGLVTDIVGFLSLVPLTRAVFKGLVIKAIKRRIAPGVSRDFDDW